MQNFSSKKRGNYPRNSHKRIFLIIGGIIITLVILFFFRGFVGSVAAGITTPFYEFRTWLFGGAGTIPEFFRDRKDLLARIDVLEEKVGAESGYESTIALIDNENRSLRDLIGRGIEDQRIVSGVIARPPFLPYDSVIIDKGLDDGVNDGNVVYHKGDQVLGRVVHAYAKSSLVALLSTSDVLTTVYVVGPDIYTNAYGMGGGVIRVSVPQGIVLTQGDLVLMPGLARGILGTIDTINSVPSEPEQDGFITSHINLQSLRYVTVSTRNVEPVSFETARTEIEKLKTMLFKVDVPKGVLVEHSTTSTTTNAGTSTPIN